MVIKAISEIRSPIQRRRLLIEVAQALSPEDALFLAKLILKRLAEYI